MRRLLLSRRAEADLEDIWIYSFDSWGEAQAYRYLDEFADGLRRCATKPERGKDRSDVRCDCRSLPVRKHVIFYTFTDDEVLIQRILHSNMDPEFHLLDDVGA